MADNPIILLHPLRGAARSDGRRRPGAARPHDAADGHRGTHPILGRDLADIVSKGLLRGLSPQRAQEGADDWAQLVAKRLIELKAAVPVAGSA